MNLLLVVCVWCLRFMRFRLVLSWTGVVLLLNLVMNLGFWLLLLAVRLIRFPVVLLMFWIRVLCRGGLLTLLVRLACGRRIRLTLCVMA